MVNKYQSEILAFQEFNSPETAYILGFLWADGYLVHRKYNLGLCCNIASDDAHEIIPNFLQTGDWYIWHAKKPRKITWKKQSTLRMRNICLYHKMMSYNFDKRSEGYSPINLIEDIPENLHHYWYLGYFDGDGSLYISKDKYNSHMTLSGQYSQDWGFITNLFQSLGINKWEEKQKISKKGHKSSIIRLSHRLSIAKFGDYIYSDINFLSLTRKKNTYLKLKDIIRTSKRNVKPN